VADNALQICRICKVPEIVTDANVRFSFGHDTGDSLIAGIADTWEKLATQVHQAPTAKEREAAAAEMMRLRPIHQQNSVLLTAPHLENFPLRYEVLGGILDHDTRNLVKMGLSNPLIWPGYDADWLARVSLICVFSRTSGKYDRGDPETVYEILRKQFTKESFLIPASFHVARLELTTTMLAVHELMKWDHFPQEFENGYKDEIGVVRAKLGTPAN